MKDEDLLKVVAKGNPGAINFLRAVTFIVHIWDDLIDQDVPVTTESINKAFQIALIDLPANRFYMENVYRIHPLLVTSMYNWITATEMERGGETEDLHIAYILRSSYVDILVMVAWIVGGDEWAREMTPKIRRAAHREGYVGYLQSLEEEQLAREER